MYDEQGRHQGVTELPPLVDVAEEDGIGGSLLDEGLDAGRVPALQVAQHAVVVLLRRAVLLLHPTNQTHNELQVRRQMWHCLMLGSH